MSKSVSFQFAAPWIEKTCAKCGARRSLYTSSWDLSRCLCFRCRKNRRNSRQAAGRNRIGGKGRGDKICARGTTVSSLGWPCQGARGGIKAFNRFPLTVARARSFLFSRYTRTDAQL